MGIAMHGISAAFVGKQVLAVKGTTPTRTWYTQKKTESSRINFGTMGTNISG
jgi:hypothetical protein